VINESNWMLNLCVPTLHVADVSYNSAQILHLLKDTGAEFRAAAALPVSPAGS